MSIWQIFFIAVALGIDAFAVAVGAGSYFGNTSSRQKFRLSFHFGLFQFLMPVIGWIAGAEIVGVIADYDHWVAFLILAFIGGKMIKESFSDSEATITADITRGMSLISLSVATSIDALAVGFSIGIIGGNIILPSIIIGLTAAAMTLVGIKFGEKLSERFGSRITFAGGVVLIIIGLNIVFEHLEVL